MLNDSPFKSRAGLRSIFNALGYSFDGITAAWRHEAAFRQVVLLFVIGDGCLIWMVPPLWFVALIVLSQLICLIVALLNSAIEAAVDYSSLKPHKLAKRAKDLGVSAQFVSLVLLAFLWGLCIFAMVKSK